MTLSAMTARLRRVTVVTLLLVLLGAGSAAAYWTAHALLQDRATAASVGLEQSLALADGASPLAGTYTAENLSLAGAVTITNTGSRTAQYTLDVNAGPATSSALPAAVQVTAMPVADAPDCSPQAKSSEARTGTLAEGLALHGAIDAGATVTVCVQTHLTAADHAALEGGTLELAMTSSLEYAEAEQWRIAADQAMTVTQTVEAAAPVDPEVQTMTLVRDGPWVTHLGFISPNAEERASYRNQVDYRMFIAHADSPEKRIELSNQPTQDWYPVVQLKNTSDEVTQLVARSGHGDAWLYVEMKLPGESDWTPVATGMFHTTPTAGQVKNTTGVYFGWQE